jgi:hypothetical protein
MIQFNLLPDVKIEYIKAQRTRQTMLSVSVLVTIASLVIFGLTLGANLLQKRNIKNLSKDITSQTAQLKNKPGIDRVLTVQNQLGTLTTLHGGKPAVTRLFTYLNQITPNEVSITSFNADFNTHLTSIVGTTDSIGTANKFVDTLKFTMYTTSTVTQQTHAFTDVVLSSFSVASKSVTSSSPTGTKTSTFTVSLTYAPDIFDIKQDKVNLIVPSIITTRSEVDKPTDLFTTAPSGTSTGGKK